MANEESINVEFQANDARSVKMLSRLYDCHLVLNDIAVRMNDEINEDKELTVPNEEDVQNINDTFGKSVQVFTDIVDAYGDVNKYVDNFFGTTQEFAKPLVSEMIEFNNGISEISDIGLENYDEEKLNEWINELMNAIIATNGAFNNLIGK